jgi:hypothetical protein
MLEPSNTTHSQIENVQAKLLDLNVVAAINQVRGWCAGGSTHRHHCASNRSIDGLAWCPLLRPPSWLPALTENPATNHHFHAHPPKVWLAIFGVIMMLLETSSYNNFLSKRVSKWLSDNMKILTYMTGRGFFYIFVGTLELGFWFSTLHLVIGAILCALGGLTVSVGWMLGAKFRSIRRELAQEDTVRTMRIGMMGRFEFAG